MSTQVTIPQTTSIAVRGVAPNGIGSLLDCSIANTSSGNEEASQGDCVPDPHRRARGPQRQTWLAQSSYGVDDRMSVVNKAQHAASMHTKVMHHTVYWNELRCSLFYASRMRTAASSPLK